MESREVEFSSVLRNSLGEHESGKVTRDISEVLVKGNLTFFTINEQKFVTFGHYLYHEKSPLYDSTALLAMADQHYSPEDIVAQKKRYAEQDTRFNLWQEHKVSAIKIVMIKAFEILKEKGDDAFMKYITYHFDIMPEDNIDKLLAMLNKPRLNKDE